MYFLLVLNCTYKFNFLFLYFFLGVKVIIMGSLGRMVRLQINSGCFLSASVNENSFTIKAIAILISR
jgi:hypothetical protein